MPRKQSESGQQTEQDGGTLLVEVASLREVKVYRREISRLVMEGRSLERNGLNWIRRIGNG